MKKMFGLIYAIIAGFTTVSAVVVALMLLFMKM